MAGKYSGPYIPGAGGDDESPPAPRLSLQEKYGSGRERELWRERRENKERLEIWMNGREPVEWWEHYNEGTPPQSFYCMEFPETYHYFVVAWERGMNVPLGFEGEMGKVYAWCFACDATDCGACRWIRKAYASATRRRVRDGDADDGDLPF